MDGRSDVKALHCGATHGHLPDDDKRSNAWRVLPKRPELLELSCQSIRCEARQSSTIERTAVATRRHPACLTPLSHTPDP